jgi:hypothetical protein
MMAKTKREYILATCFLSGAAAIISFISLGTEEWVTAIATLDGDSEDNSYKFGLFGGIFKQRTIQIVEFELTTVCAFGYNICALLCGNEMEKNLEDLYNNITFDNTNLCTDSVEARGFETRLLVRDSNEIGDKLQLKSIKFRQFQNHLYSDINHNYHYMIFKITEIFIFYFRRQGIYKCRCLGVHDFLFNNICSNGSAFCRFSYMEYGN